MRGGAEFEDRAAAQAYYDSATYTQARQVREGAGSIDMIVVDAATDLFSLS